MASMQISQRRIFGFLQKGYCLYLTCFKWPDNGKVLIKSLDRRSENITTVSLLGSNRKLTWTATDKGLSVDLPMKHPSEWLCVKGGLR